MRDMLGHMLGFIATAERLSMHAARMLFISLVTHDFLQLLLLQYALIKRARLTYAK